MIVQNVKIIFIIALFLLPFSSFAAIPEISKIEVNENLKSFGIYWSKPNLAETEGVVLVKKNDSCPKSIEDGIEIYRGNGNEYLDVSVEAGKRYCYGVFIYDGSGQVSNITTSNLKQKKGFFGCLTDFFQNNHIIFVGVIIVIVLLYINKKTLKTPGCARSDLA